MGGLPSAQQAICLVAAAILLLPASGLPNFIIFQPDDMYFYDHWSPPANPPGKPRRRYESPGLPNIERIRTEGIHVQNAYVASPACGTSRFATLTGLYPSRSNYSRERSSGGHDSSSGRSKVSIPNTKLSAPDCAHSMPSLLKTLRSYRTGIVGKWHLTAISRNGYTYAGAQQEVRDCGFDFADGLYVENFEADGGFFGDSTGPAFSHNMEWVTRKGLDFIGGGDPFFLYFNPTAPHTPDVKAALETANCIETPAGSLPDETSLLNIEGMTSGHASCTAYRQSVLSRGGTDGGHLGAVWIDDAMGALLTALEARGVLNNTVIIFMLDHGMESKMALFQNGVRTAMFIRHPPSGSGTEFAGPATNLDLARIVLNLAGIENSELAARGTRFDGADWLSELGNPSTDWSQRCLFEEYELDRAVICGCYKYISLLPGAESTTRTRATQGGYPTEDEQLYNFCDGNTEQSEGTNLIQDAQHASALAVLRDALRCHEGQTSFQTNPMGWDSCGSGTTTTTEAMGTSLSASTSSDPASTSPVQASSTLVTEAATTLVTTEASSTQASFTLATTEAATTLVTTDTTTTLSPQPSNPLHASIAATNVLGSRALLRTATLLILAYGVA